MFSPNLIRHCASCYRGISVSGSISLGPSIWILDIPSNGWRWSLYPALPARERETHTHTQTDRERKRKREGEQKRQRGPCWHLALGNDLLRSFDTIWFCLHICSTASSIFIFSFDTENFLLSWAFLGAFFLIYFFLNTFPDNPLGFGLFSVSSQQQLVFWGCFGQKWSAVAAV